MSLTARLPDRPDHPYYREIMDIYNGETDREFARYLFRALCEADFWAYCRYASSMRRFRIREEGHPLYGDLWINAPEIFELCRTFQENLEMRVKNVFYNMPRYTFKTLILTRHATCWRKLPDPTHTTAVICWKIDQVGMKIFRGIASEMRHNRMLIENWPSLFWQEGEVPDLWRDRMLNLKRPPGPEEPTVSIHGLDSLPTSFHVDDTIFDDCVTKQAVRTGRSVAFTLESIREAKALGKEDTMAWHLGTIWKAGDPNIQLQEEGFFGDVYHRSALTGTESEMNYSNDAELQALIANGKPYLHTRETWADWFKDLGFSIGSCQLQNRPMGKGDRYFRENWLKDHLYTETPEVCAETKNNYIIIDQAGEGQKSDYFAILALGLAFEPHRYALDLWRERGLSLAEFYTIMLGQDETAHDPDPVPAWIAAAGISKGGLIAKWKPKKIFIEEFFLTGYLAALKLEAKRRGVNISIVPLKHVKHRSKEDRIAYLQAPFQRGEYHFPAQMFGHGSKPGEPASNLDTYVQFKNKEYLQWVCDPDANESDDMLDVLAWPIQPEVKSAFQFLKPKKTAEAVYFPQFARGSRQLTPRRSAWAA